MATFEASKSGKVVVLTVVGRLDPSAGKELNAALSSAADSEPQAPILVDLAGVDYMASAGFRELFLAGRKLGRQGRQLAVCSLGGEVLRIFELAQFDTAYPVFATREEALGSLGA
ncbi:MAG: hypothetical protein Fur0032_17320 [Terrimicrobiaceae bacterium]